MRRSLLCLALLSCAAQQTKRGEPRTGTAPIASDAEGKGVSLTGTGAYGERHDPSGWSGQTAPTAVGGGPALPPPKPAASASTMPPSKELDTAPPARDLQF